MSSDRLCHMSDLRAFRSEVDQDIAAARAMAHRAEANARAIEKDIDRVNDHISGLATDISSLSSDLGALTGEVGGQRQRLYDIEGTVVDLEAQQQGDHRLIERNQHAITNLEHDISTLEQDVDANRQALTEAQKYAESLAHEISVAERRISANEQHIQHLQHGLQAVNQRIDQAQQRQEAELLAQAQDVRTQKQLAATLRKTLDLARVQRFGYESDYVTALTTLDHAEASTNLKQFQAARATYQEAQRQLAQVRREVNTREREYRLSRSRCEASLQQAAAALQQAGTEDMLYWHRTDYQAIKAEYERLQQRFQAGEFDRAGRPEQVVTAIEQLTNGSEKLIRAVGGLDNQLALTIQKAGTRADRMEKMLNALMDIWGQNDFPFQTEYLSADDPKGTLKVQTQRPNRPNVTLYLELDGTAQFSWTGYVGMECAKDEKQFAETLRRQYKLELAVTKSQDKPGQPNPDWGPGGPKVNEPIVMGNTGQEGTPKEKRRG